MILSPLVFVLWSLIINLSLLPYEAAGSNDESPRDSDPPANVSSSATVAGSGESPLPADPVPPNQQSPPLPATTLSPREPHLRRRSVDEGETSRPADPPALWLNSLDSLRCTKDSAVAPGDSTCEGPDAWHRASDGSRGVYFAAVGDTGLPEGGLKLVSNRLAEVSSLLPVSFISLLGDNFYPDGVRDRYDPMFNTHFEVPFQHPSLRRVAFFPIFGNHDYKLSPQAQVDRYYMHCSTCKQPQDWNSAKFRWRFPNPWYFSRLVYNNVPHDLSASPTVTNTAQMKPRQYGASQPGDGRSMIVVNVHLDSNVFWRSHASAEKQLDFLEKVLQAAAAEADWIFVHQHHPLFTDGTPARNAQAYQNMLLPLYLQYGVDAVFAGHEHLLSHFELNGPDGSIGPVVQVISGSGSKLHKQRPPKCCNSGTGSSCDSAPPCPSKNCTFQETTHGFVLVELSAKQMHLQYIDAETGTVISHSTYQSKKAGRLLSFAGKLPDTGNGTTAGPQIAAASEYPTIRRVAVPKELTGKWLGQYELNPFFQLLFLFSMALVCLWLLWRCCPLGKFLSTTDVRYIWARWRRLRQSSFEPVESPIIVGAAKPPATPTVSDSAYVATGPGTAIALDVTGWCEMRKQRAEEGISLV